MSEFRLPGNPGKEQNHPRPGNRPGRFDTGPGAAHVTTGLFLLLLVGVMGILTACGPRLVQGKAPFLSISSLAIEDERLSASFSVRNINDVVMDIDAIEITIRIADAELTRYAASLALSVDPNTTEEVRVERLPDEFSRSLLSSLEQGDSDSLPFSMSGQIRSVQDGYQAFQHEGYLFPVPGRPGHYRSTSRQTPERRRPPPLSNEVDYRR